MPSTRLSFVAPRGWTLRRETSPVPATSPPAPGALALVLRGGRLASLTASRRRSAFLPPAPWVERSSLPAPY